MSAKTVTLKDTEGALYPQTLSALVSDLNGNTLGDELGYQFMGVATCNPASPEDSQSPGTQKVYWIATQSGTYSNLGGVVVADGEVAIISWDGTWHKKATGAATADQLNQLAQVMRTYPKFIDGEIKSEKQLSFIDGSFKQQSGTAINTASASFLSTIVIPANGGEIIDLKLMLEPPIGNYPSYFVFAIDDSTAAINSADIENYVEEIDSVNHIYRLSVPEGTTKIFSTCYTTEKADVYAIKIDQIHENNLDAGLKEKINNPQEEKDIDFPLDVNGYIGTNGAFMFSAYWFSTDFVPVVSGDIIKYKLTGDSGASTIAFYDETKSFISGLSFDSGIVSGETAIPDGCAYVRGCVYTEHKSQAYFKVLSTAIPEQINVLSERISKAADGFTLFDSIKKPIDFSGKTINVFGDSITYGVCSPGLGNAGENSYINIFKALSGCAVMNNYAMSGAPIVPSSGLMSIYEKIISISTSCDIIMIAGGINDWQMQKNIGVLGDDNNVNLYGVMKKICDYIKTTYPNAYVVFITPIPTTSLLTFGVQHPDNLNLYRKAIQEVAALNGFSVVNGAGLGLPDRQSAFGNAMFAPTDCVHPTLAGHALYGHSLSGKLL